MKPIKTGTFVTYRVFTEKHFPGIAASTLRARIQSGEFVLGVHYLDYRLSDKGQGEYLYNPEEILKLWSTPPAERKPAQFKA